MYVGDTTTTIHLMFCAHMYCSCGVRPNYLYSITWCTIIIYLHLYTLKLIGNFPAIVNVQEENELHERLAELERKEKYLMAKGKDYTRQHEQGTCTCTLYAQM